MTDEQRAAAFKAVYAEINRRDADNLEQLKKLIPPDGWFLKSKYCADEIEAAWHIVQHAFNMNPAFMPVILARLEKLLPLGEVDQEPYAMIYDRVALLDGRMQRYGTQRIYLNYKWSLYPVEEPAGLERRRRAMKIKMTVAEEMATLPASCPSNYDKPLPK